MEASLLCAASREYLLLSSVFLGCYVQEYSSTPSSLAGIKRPHSLSKYGLLNIETDIFGREYKRSRPSFVASITVFVVERSGTAIIPNQIILNIFWIFYNQSFNFLNLDPRPQDLVGHRHQDNPRNMDTNVITAKIKAHSLITFWLGRFHILLLWTISNTPNLKQTPLSQITAMILDLKV